MLPDDRIRLEHMRDAIRTASQFMAGRTKADLDTDLQLQFALARAIEIVGEAASRLSQEFRSAQPQIPWPFIISMRNRLAHAYFDLDNDVIWLTATRSLPELDIKLALFFDD